MSRKSPLYTVKEFEEFIRAQGPEGCPRAKLEDRFRRASGLDLDVLLTMSGKIRPIRGLVDGNPAIRYMVVGGEVTPLEDKQD